jgi:vacuolar-type H+-ATPase subunit I/STV1
MTAEQAEKYPPAPDTGAVELDAMEELDPGLLARIVREKVAQFHDFDLEERVDGAEAEAKLAVENQAKEAIAEEVAAIEEIKAEAEEIYEKYRPRLAELADELGAELAPLDERLESLQRTAREKLEALEPDLPEIPEGETEGEPDDEGWLFDSRRDYLEQLRAYRNGHGA